VTGEAGYGWVRVQRLALGMSQEDCARRAGISRNYLSQLERGVSDNPSERVVKRLRNLLGVAVSGCTTAHLNLSMVVNYAGIFRGLLCEDCGRRWDLYEIRRALGGEFA